MMQFFPFSLIEEKGFLDQFSREGETLEMEGIPRKIRQVYKRTQIVFDMGELIRYVIFRERIYEPWKEVSSSRMAQDNTQKMIEGIKKVGPE